MPTPQEFRSRLAFGPFEVDAAAGELLKSGVRIRLPAQPFRILLLLLETPDKVVTRERLREQIWGDGTFVDFEHGLNAAINKLRRTLGDSAEKPRYIETVPGRGYRFIGAMDASPTGAVRSSIAEERPRKRRWWLAASLACLAVLAIALGLRSAASTPPITKLTRITNEPGLSSAPAISRDGKLVAYSYTTPEGGQDLYVRQISGGQPVRLTFDGAGNTGPDFSPDGSRIVFRSSRNGGGIYEIPTLGGQARLVAPEGLEPKFSPDGTQIAYWIGVESTALAVPWSGTVWVSPASGGQARRVGSSFTSAKSPIWAPGGKKLLLRGYTSAVAFDSSSVDWWLVSIEGDRAIRTGTYEALVGGGLQARDFARNPTSNAAQPRTPVPSVPKPACWSALDNAVTFSFQNGDTQNLWEIVLSPETGKASGVPKRLTTGSGNEVDPSCAAGGLVAFTNAELKRELWFVAFDLDNGQSKGALQRMWQDPAKRETPSLSQDGKRLAFSSDQAGPPNIWIQDRETGQESIVAGSSYVQRFPTVSPSGARVAFSAYETDKRVVYEAAPGGTPVKLCDGCLRATSWSRDEKQLLVYGGSPFQIDILDVASHERTPLLKHPTYNLLYGRFSPDDRWISFTARPQTGRGRITIAPVDGPRPVPESAWITIAEAAGDDFANWSLDGKTLYYTSPKDGHTCLWAQRIEANSGRRVGEPFAALHLHGRLQFGHGGWSAAGGRIVLALVEAGGDIWTMSQPGR